MKKKAIIALVCIAAVLAMTGCGKVTITPEETESEALQLEVAENELAAFTFNEKEMMLPLSYAEFSEKTGYTFENTFESTACPVVTTETVVPAFTTFGQQYSIGDSGYLTVLFANMSTVEQKAQDCLIIGVKAMRFHRADCDLDLQYAGTDWDSSLEEIKATLGEPANEEADGPYYLLGYSVKNDDKSNVSYSFVAGKEEMYSFALSIDFLNIAFDSLPVGEE